MKTLYKLLFVSLIAMGFSACSKDEGIVSEVDTPEPFIDLTFDRELIEVGIKDSTSFNILTGGDNYKVFSLNPQIIEVSIENNVVKVLGISKGKSSIVISDNNGTYKKLPVVSKYSTIQLDKDTLSLKLKYGSSSSSQSINILQGNGDYKAETDNDSVATASVNNNIIIIYAKAEGSANITITDGMGVSIVIPINIIITTDPYSDEELESLKNKKSPQYTWTGVNGTFKRDTKCFYGTNYNIVENGFNKYGWEQYGMGLVLWFEGDKTVGKKTSAKVKVINLNWETHETSKDVNLEVIKNDGNYIWVIFSYIYKEKLYYGNFVQKIEK